MKTTRPKAFSVASAKELVQAVKPIDDSLSILQVLNRFQDNADLFALPIQDPQNRFCGVVSRRHYLNLMTKAYARELYAKKPLSYLMRRHRAMFMAPLIAHAEQSIDKVMVAFLERDPQLQYDALPVIENGKVIGIVNVADMMLKLSQAQGQLIKTMKQLSARLHAEVEQAAMLQRNLLQPNQIDLPGIRGLASMTTASEVGGDFYDYYSVGKNWVVLLMGDVSGHGIAAGTIVCAVKAAVNILHSEAVKDPREILDRLNSVIYNTAHQQLLMTMFAISIDTGNGEIHYANAGHQFAYLYRSTLDLLEPMEVGGLPLGKSTSVEYEVVHSELDVGDRLFLYTDAMIEEEDPQGECFGYDRLEQLLSEQADQDIGQLLATLLQHLYSHTGKTHLEDDVTLLCVEHYQRIPNTATTVSEVMLATDGWRLPYLIAEASYRFDPSVVSASQPRQDMILLSDGGFADLLPSLAKQGVRRVLPRLHPINQHLSWETLLVQHHQHFNNDLSVLMPQADCHREFDFRHSEDKAFALEEIHAWLHEQSLPNPERLEEVIFLLDEIIENGLYAAPRDGKGRALFGKGSARQLADDESLRLVVSRRGDLLGLAITDNWGTLTPQVFLNRLSHHAQGLGLDAGIGGGGLYLIWRMADYLQIRVIPNQQTQVTLFLDLSHHGDELGDKGFQFLYHSELQEMVNDD